ncbi:MAG: TIM barrel protein [Verrucomicrobiota bacterium]
MKPTPSISRRSALRRTAGAAAFAATTAGLHHRIKAAEESLAAAGLKGNVNHSACKWCYKKIPLEDFCVAANEIGLQSVELLNPPDFPTLKKHNLHCAMVSFPTGEAPDGTKVGGIPNAFNRPEYHDTLVEIYKPHLKASADAGFTNVICFSGNRNGMDDEQGLENCVTGLKKILPLAEKQNITLCMELLNSKVNHKDYMCDTSNWGVELCKRLDSENFKLLYDIYHMQIMEGDVIATIREKHPYFAHYHTGGVPGRAEIDDTQELNYPAIIKAVLETGYDGFIGQEFIPARDDKLASLKQGVEICDV